MPDRHTVAMARGCRASFLLHGAVMPWQMLLCEVQLTQFCSPLLPVQKISSLDHASSTHMHGRAK